MMKWTSSNSSLNSPNDRKSVFYTNTEVTGIIKKRNSVSDNIFTFKMGDDTADETAQSQKSKSSTVKNNNDEKSGDLKKYLQNYMLFSNLEKESEKKCRDEQLSKIVKALFCFESKLRQEQQIIQQQLYEKDVVINQQMHTISNMKELYGVECEGGDSIDESCLPETAKYCPMCRKQYYLMNLKNMSTQTNDQNNNNKYPISIIKSSHNSDDYSSIQSIEYMSSSDEQKSLLSPNPFSTARRSKKYTSKKSYKEYLKTRLHTPINCTNSNNNINNNINNNNVNSNINTSSDFPNSDSNNNNKNNKNNNINISNEANRTNRENLNGMESNGKTNGTKFSLIMNDIHGIRQQQQSHDAYDTHSLKVNRMHGINHNSINEVSSTLSNYQQKLNGNDIGSMANANSNRDNGGIESKDNLITITNVNEDKVLYNNTIATQRINSSPLSHNGHHNVTTISTNKTVIGLDSTRKYTEGMELNKKIATTDDWYVSASDVEDSDSTVMGKSYGKSTVNPVLECVNQILLQQSMDEFMDSSSDNKNNMELKSPKESQPAARSSKRVHFSTQNSMVQVPRNSTQQSEMKNSYEIQSIYSNEYEQVGGSDNTSNANFYVDMDVKIDSDDNDRDSFEKRKIPPALPPKPANLIKLQQISKQRLVNQKQPILKQKKLSEYDPSESEPDYCSISEIQDVVKSVKIVTSAEIHNNADNDYSEIKEDIEVPIIKAPPPPLPSASLSEMDESFADVPKLPNVTEIIAPQTPRKDPAIKCIGHDNYITKSPFSKKSATQNNKDSIAILAEINNIKMLPSKPSPTRKLAPSSPLDNINHQQTIKIVDDKLQEEFDWYNLDAEYDRPANSQPEVIKEIDNLADMYQFDENLNSMGDVDDDDPKVEYNLDFEYDHEQDIVEIESNNNFTTVIKINEPSNNNSTTNNNNNNNDDTLASPVSNPTTNNFIELAETPKLDFHLKKKLNYEKFLKESGLASKMLPLSTRKNNNRMFYAGPFV